METRLIVQKLLRAYSFFFKPYYQFLFFLVATFAKKHFQEINMVGIRNHDGQVLAKDEDGTFYWSDDQNAVEVFDSIEAAVNFIEDVYDGDVPQIEIFFSYWWYIEHNQ